MYSWSFIHFHHYVVSSSSACVLSCIRLFVSSWTVALQAPLSLGFSWQEYWSGLPFPPLGNLPNPGIGSNPRLWCFLHWQADSLLLSHQRSPLYSILKYNLTTIYLYILLTQGLVMFQTFSAHQHYGTLKYEFRYTIHVEAQVSGYAHRQLIKMFLLAYILTIRRWDSLLAYVHTDNQYCQICLLHQSI